MFLNNFTENSNKILFVSKSMNNKIVELKESEDYVVEGKKESNTDTDVYASALESNSWGILQKKKKRITKWMANKKNYNKIRSHKMFNNNYNIFVKIYYA